MLNIYLKIYIPIFGKLILVIHFQILKGTLLKTYKPRNVFRQCLEVWLSNFMIKISCTPQQAWFRFERKHTHTYIHINMYICIHNIYIYLHPSTDIIIFIHICNTYICIYVILLIFGLLFPFYPVLYVCLLLWKLK